MSKVSYITKRHLEVIELMKQGLSNEAIGDKLFITEKSVKFHITDILRLLKLKSRAELIATFIRYQPIQLKAEEMVNIREMELKSQSP